MAIRLKKSSKKAVLSYIKFMIDQTTQIRDEILLAVLPDVAFDGWNWDTVCAAADKTGHSENTVRAVFPGKMVDVLDHFADWADREMLKVLEKINPDDLRVRDRVREALLARFEVLNSYKDAVNQSLHFWMWPTRKPRAVKITWRLADRIWDWTGDTATDYNRYTKRGLLSGVIVSTTLAWLNDSSDGNENTKAFLDRRIENVMQLGKVARRFKKKVS